MRVRHTNGEEDTGTISTRVGPCNKSPQKILIGRSCQVDHVFGSWELQMLGNLVNEHNT